MLGLQALLCELCASEDDAAGGGESERPFIRFGYLVYLTHTHDRMSGAWTRVPDHAAALEPVCLSLVCPGVRSGQVSSSQDRLGPSDKWDSLSWLSSVSSMSLWLLVLVLVSRLSIAGTS